jgi:hypothetical protein
MLVEVIKRPYRKYKVGQKFEIKPKEARLLIILKRVKEVSDGKPKEPVPAKTTKTPTPASKPVIANKADVDLSDPNLKGKNPGTKKAGTKKTSAKKAAGTSTGTEKKAEEKSE